MVTGILKLSLTTPVLLLSLILYIDYNATVAGTVINYNFLSVYHKSASVTLTFCT